MQSSALSSIGFDDDDEDDNYVVTTSSNCWRYSEGDEQEAGQTSVKKEVVDDDVKPTIKNIPTPSVGCVSTIKNKSKSESEYSANAVKKVNDLLRDSESSNYEAEYTNRLIIPPRQQEQVFTNVAVRHNNSPKQVPNNVSQIVTTSVQPTLTPQYIQDLTRVPQEPNSTTQYAPTHVHQEPAPVTQYAPTHLFQEPTPATQYAPTRLHEDITPSYMNSSYTHGASTSDPGPRNLPSPSYGYEEPYHMIQNQASNSNDQNTLEIEQEEQVIKLIHTSDATLPYMCSACNMHSSNLGVMKQHIADHKKGVIKCPLLGLSKNVFICPFGNCEFNSPNYARVLTHLNKFHGKMAEHLIKQITSATLPEAVEALNDKVAPLTKRESIWKEVSFQKKPQAKLYACSECDFKNYDYKTVIQHLHGHLNANKKQKTG